ncbi:MAG: PhnD/SsuA/transferrin family substrate-binding protein [Pseudomonadota bacterium]|nr:MAG: PhnD/SsuA/transferrin family substrate-binding protein [Pseudomonadota bacterium]
MNTKHLLQLGASMLLAIWAANAAANKPYILTAPPRDSGGAEADVYEPIAQYLSAATGKKIDYRHYDNWLTYQDRMRRDEFDIVFDGPHFVGWRIVKLDHEPLVRLPGKLAFVVAVKKDNDKIASVKDLAGRTVCGLAPPNLATLTVLNQFDNPARQPIVVEVKSFKESYAAMANGKCVASILRDNAFKRFNEEKKLGKVIFKSEGIANQGFSVSKRVADADRIKIVQALTAPDAPKRLKAFFERYNKDKDLAKTSRDEYQDLGKLLRDVWGFDLAAESATKR